MDFNNLKARVDFITQIKDSFSQAPDKAWRSTQQAISSSGLSDLDKKEFFQASSKVLQDRKKLATNMLSAKTAPKALMVRIRGFLIKEYEVDIGARDLKTSVFPDIPLRLAVFLPYRELCKFTGGSARAPRLCEYVFVCEDPDLVGMPTELTTLHELSHEFSNCLHPELLKNVVVGEKRDSEGLTSSLNQLATLNFREVQTEVAACMWNFLGCIDLDDEIAGDYIQEATARFQGYIGDYCNKVLSFFPSAKSSLKDWQIVCNQETNCLRELAVRIACQTNFKNKESVWKAYILLVALNKSDLKEEATIEEIVGLL
jgi:hypothetical protein